MNQSRFKRGDIVPLNVNTFDGFGCMCVKHLPSRALDLVDEYSASCTVEACHELSRTVARIVEGDYHVVILAICGCEIDDVVVVMTQSGHRTWLWVDEITQDDVRVVC